VVANVSENNTAEYLRRGPGPS